MTNNCDRCGNPCERLLSGEDYDPSDYYNNLCEDCCEIDYSKRCSLCQQRAIAITCIFCNQFTTKLCCQFHKKPCCDRDYPQTQQACEKLKFDNQLKHCSCGIMKLMIQGKSRKEAFSEVESKLQDDCSVHEEKMVHTLAGVPIYYRE